MKTALHSTKGGSKQGAVDIDPKHQPPSAEASARTDEQLIAAYQAGDKDSFKLLVSRYERELFHFLVRFLNDRAAA